MRLSSALYGFTVLGITPAHPGEAEEHATPARRESLHYAKWSIASCQEEFVAHGIKAQAIKRRTTLVDKIRTKRGIPMRKHSLEYSLNTSHLSNGIGLTADVDDATLFSGGLSCVLQP